MVGGFKHLAAVFLGALACLVSASVSAEMIGVDFGPGAGPANWSSVQRAGTYKNLVYENGEPTPVELVVDNAGKAFGVAPLASTIPAHAVDLTGLDGNGYQFNGTFKATFRKLEPGKSYDVYLFGLRSGAALSQSVSLRGENRVRYLQVAGDSELAINDQVGSSSRPLPSYAKPIIASAQGEIEITVVGGGQQGSPFVVAGLALDESTSEVPATSDPARIATAQPVAQSKSVRPSIASTADIRGVRLGVSMQDARSALAASGGVNAIIDGEQDVVTIYGSRLEGLKYRNLMRAVLPTGKAEVYGYAPPNEGVVAGVAIEQNLDRMLYADFRALLIEKYGEPISEHIPVPGKPQVLENPIISWSFKADGTPQRDSNALFLCAGGRGTVTKAMYSIHRASRVRDDNYGECGFILAYRIRVLPNQTPLVAHNYNAILYDMNEILDKNQETIDFTIAEAEKIRAQEMESIKKAKKPIL